MRKVWFEAVGFVDCPVWRRADLPHGDRITGPAIIEEYAATTVLFPGDRAEVGAYEEVHIVIGA